MDSTHARLLQSLKEFAKTVYTTIVTGVTQEDEYMLSDIQLTSEIDVDPQSYADSFAEEIHDWILDSEERFDDSLIANVDAHCIIMSDYLFARTLIDVCYKLMANDLSSTDFITMRLD